MQVQMGDIGHSIESRGDGEPILFIHGFPLSSQMWAEVSSRMPVGYRSLMPDLRGHGSTAPGANATMEGYADDLLGLLDALSIDTPVVIVALSMGGYVAFELVRKAPKRVRALVLANTRAAPDTPDQADGRRTAAARVLNEGSESLAEEMAGKMFSSGTPKEVRSDWRRRMARTSPHGAAAALLAMAGRPDSFETLRGFTGPTLVIAGREDRITPIADHEAMAAASPNARLEVIEGAGHLTPVEQPDRFADVLIDFLESLPRVRLSR